MLLGEPKTTTHDGVAFVVVVVAVAGVIGVDVGTIGGDGVGVVGCWWWACVGHHGSAQNLFGSLLECISSQYRGSGQSDFV